MGGGAGLYFHHPVCLEHDPRAHMPMHPDTPARIVALEATLAEAGWMGWERRAAPAASESELELVHSERHVLAIRELCAAGGGESTRTRTSARPPTARRCTRRAPHAR